MKFMILIASIFVALTICEVSGQSLYCYSCSSNFGSSYGNLNSDCLGNLTSRYSRRCYSPSYCLTSYVVGNGVVSSLRRTCQNPRYDYDDDSTSAPTENKCVSSHSSYNSRSTTTCYFPCTTSRCNNQTPSSIKKCPSSCATSCDILTGKCPTVMSCVQCSSETDKSCEKKTQSTTCPGSSYNHCVATKSYVLNAAQTVVLTTVTKSCTTISNSYDFPSQPCVFESRGSSNEFTKYSCSTFCSTKGCNERVEDPGEDSQQGGLRCYVCSSTGPNGNCAVPFQTKRCPPTATHCKSTVSYYITSLQGRNGPLHQIASIKRECATEAVASDCTTSNIAGPNLRHVLCQETCQTDNCNKGWPARPKCYQCSVVNRTWTAREFQSCQTQPNRVSSCTSPAYEHCYSQSNNTASVSGASRTVRRGCSITPLETRCYDTVDSNGNSINNCQTSCDTDSCNNDRLQ